MTLDYNKAVDITKRYQAEIDKITGRYIDEMKAEFGENYLARENARLRPLLSETVEDFEKSDLISFKTQLCENPKVMMGSVDTGDISIRVLAKENMGDRELTLKDIASVCCTGFDIKSKE